MVKRQWEKLTISVEAEVVYLEKVEAVVDRRLPRLFAVAVGDRRRVVRSELWQSSQRANYELEVVVEVQACTHACCDLHSVKLLGYIISIELIRNRTPSQLEIEVLV